MTAMARLTTLLVAMWLGVTVSTVVDLEKRIIGGQECGPNERLYHVQLISTDGQHQYLCGGSLISDQWILTAAHCYKPGRTFTAHISVHAGPPKRVRITDRPVIFNDGKQHDLMLLKLPKAVVGVKPVRAPDCQHPPKRDAVVQVAGHGSTKVGPNNERKPGSSDTLHCADMDVIDSMARLTTLLVAMWLGVTVSTVVDLEKRIIGGHECGPKERLYHVQLTTNHRTFCGGSLISDRWILTAEHCYKSGREVTAHIGVHPGPATEVLITDRPVIYINNSKQHDLMLLKLPKAVVGITPVPLPDCKHPPNM
ncbi:anionic trypsin-like [Hippoglossus stenolepis]|uniref:anionic trypsin-like n=1 Tax=Hippoglossus stenolepis TaxID=195615 RepID=UPI001FB03C01|nr:anionic trypsin-like [Hippoglossus stenolepis]